MPQQDVYKTFPAGSPGVIRQDVLPGSLQSGAPETTQRDVAPGSFPGSSQHHTGVYSEPQEPTDVLSQFTDASPEQLAKFQRERDDLYASMIQRVEAEIDRIIKTMGKALEVREKELIAALHQAKQAGYPVPTNLTLPWFKHGLRGFLRKIWYGSSPDNPDWEFYTTPQPEPERATPFVPRETESTIPTLEERLYVERGIDMLVNQFLPVNEATAIDTVTNTVNELKKNLIRIIHSSLQKLYQIALSHGIRLKGGSPREKPAKGKPELTAKEPVAGPALAEPKPGDVRMNPQTGRKEIFSRHKNIGKWVDAARSARSTASSIFQALGPTPAEEPRGRDVQRTLSFGEPTGQGKRRHSVRPVPPPETKPAAPESEPTPEPTPEPTSPATRRKAGRPKGKIITGDKAIENIVQKTNRTKGVGKPGDATLISLLRELAKRGVDIYDPNAVQHGIRQVVPEYRGRGTFLQTYARKHGLDLENSEAIYQHLGIEFPGEVAAKPELESPALPPEEEEDFFGPESGDRYEDWTRSKENFVQKLRDESTPAEKVRLFTRLLKEKI